MKKNMLIIVFVFFAGILQAQGPLDKGQGQFNAGVGFSSWGVPIYLGFDVGVHRDITIGGELSFRFYNDRFEGRGYDNSIVGIAGNGNYHFNTLLNIPRNFDFYAGLNVGFYLWNTPSDYNGPHSSGLGLGAQVGGRYYFNDHFGLNLEFGGGNEFSGGKFGISVRF